MALPGFLLTVFLCGLPTILMISCHIQSSGAEIWCMPGNTQGLIPGRSGIVVL